jgi:hypothetical protein
MAGFFGEQGEAYSNSSTAYFSIDSFNGTAVGDQPMESPHHRSQ